MRVTGATGASSAVAGPNTLTASYRIQHPDTVVIVMWFVPLTRASAGRLTLMRWGRTLL